MGHPASLLVVFAATSFTACAVSPPAVPPDVLVARSAEQAALGRGDLALADLDAALAADPAHAQARYQRALLLQAAGLSARAMADIDIAVTLRPQDPTVRSARCVIQVAAERNEAGLKNCQYALVMPGASPAAVHQAYGQALQQLGREQDAQVAFQAAEAAQAAVTAPAAGAASRPVTLSSAP